MVGGALITNCESLCIVFLWMWNITFMTNHSGTD